MNEVYKKEKIDERATHTRTHTVRRLFDDLVRWFFFEGKTIEYFRKSKFSTPERKVNVATGEFVHENI